MSSKGRIWFQNGMTFSWPKRSQNHRNSQIRSNGPQGRPLQQMAANASKWQQIGANRNKLLQIAENRNKWQQMNANGDK